MLDQENQKKIKLIIKTIKEITKTGFPQYGNLAMRKDEILNLFPDIKKVKKTFKWKPNIFLKDGLKRTKRFYEKKK